ncbi:uncharacterized protein LOC123901995 isoform X3 [Trifolium pratense]|uniref:uncharacterized protein LOC123901995 isoform X3 n=1 Tax=Trifolium pratense TaxID=57577 RepID=UPI001E6955BE|nr:uncharacterized protein LOC123901995 isoform X3 [Trifolium pratense]
MQNTTLLPPASTQAGVSVSLLEAAKIPRDIALFTASIPPIRIRDTAHGNDIPHDLKQGLEDKTLRKKQSSVQLLGAMAYSAPQLSRCLPKTEVLTDSHSEVQLAVQTALRQVGSAIKKPEIAALVPTLLQGLIDPFPEVRSVAARATRSLIGVMGEKNFPNLVPWLFETIKSENSNVERPGAAQGLSEEFPVSRKIHPCLLFFKAVFIASIPPTRIRDIAHGNDIPHDLKQAGVSASLPEAAKIPRDIALFTASIPPTRIRDTAHGNDIPHDLKQGLEDKTLRKKQSSVQLLGAMAYSAPQLSRCLPKTEVLTDSHSEVQLAVQTALRQVGSAIKKPEIAALVPTLLQGLIDPFPEVRSVAARATRSLIGVMGEKNFPNLVPWLFETIKSENSNVERPGAAQGLSEEFPVSRKIHPCLLFFKAVFIASIPPTRIRDIAHGNDIPHDLKQAGVSASLPEAAKIPRDIALFTASIPPTRIRDTAHGNDIPHDLKQGGRSMIFSAPFSTGRVPQRTTYGGINCKRHYSHIPYNQYAGVFFGIAVACVTLFRIIRCRVVKYECEDDSLSPEKLRAEVDWRREGCMSAIDDQGSTKACWAHVATSAVESIVKIETDVLKKLSSQELIDCDPKNKGCQEGWVENAFDYIQREGVCMEKDYPYSPFNTPFIRMPCRVKKYYVKTFIGGYESIPYEKDFGAEERLKLAVCRQPVAVAVLIGKDFKNYKASDGIFQIDEDFEHGELHSLLIVGFGQLKEKQYWLVRNSYGVSWGYKGYGLIERNCGLPEGRCGIAYSPFYPIFKEQADPSQDSSSDTVAKTSDTKAGVSASLPEAAKIPRDIALFTGQPLPSNESTGNLED